MLSITCTLLGVEKSAALEVDRAVLPRITVGGRLVATPLVESREGFGNVSDDDDSEIDISDSSILVRFDKRVYGDEGVAGGVIGLRKTDDDSDLDDDVFFHQLNAFFWNQNFQVTVGRTRLRNFLIEFPTVRDEDLIDYIYVPDASSFREAEEDQFFGNLMSYDRFIGNKKQALSVWAAARVETDVQGDDEETTDLNSVGFSWTYINSEAVRYVEKIRKAGVLLDFQEIDDNVLSSDENTVAIVGGAEWNLNKDPSNNWSMAVQGIYYDGFDGIVFNPNASEAVRRATLRRAESWSAVVSVSNTKRPKLVTRSRFALSIAYKDYPDESDASQFSIIPSYMYRIGHAMEIVVQYRFTDFDDGIAAMTGFENDQQILVGLVFGFDQTFNDQIGERTSILNIEHGYIQ